MSEEDIKKYKEEKNASFLKLYDEKARRFENAYKDLIDIESVKYDEIVLKIRKKRKYEERKYDYITSRHAPSQVRSLFRDLYAPEFLVTVTVAMKTRGNLKLYNERIEQVGVLPPDCEIFFESMTCKKFNDELQDTVNRVNYSDEIAFAEKWPTIIRAAANYFLYGEKGGDCTCGCNCSGGKNNVKDDDEDGGDDEGGNGAPRYAP